MLLSKIHNKYKMLTITEKRIASYILENPDKVISMTSKELADICGTVASAVNRMCNSIGVEGFSKLKIMLSAEIGSGKDDISKPFNKNDDIETVFNKVFNSGINTLKNTYKMLEISKVEEISQKLKNTGRIYIFGVGTSAVIAEDAAYRFSQLGVQAYAYTDILQMTVMAKNMKKGDIAFGISHSGTTKAVVDAMRYAKKSGAETIALTSFINSLLYKESDYAVSVYADEENYPVEAVSARIAHMCVVDAFMMSIASLNFENYSQYISMRNSALNEIRY